MIYVFDDNETKPTNYHDTSGNAITLRIHPENNKHVFFSTEEECFRKCTTLSTFLPIKLPLHPWTAHLQLAFDMQHILINSIVCWFTYCIISGVTSGEFLRVLMPVHVNNTMECTKILCNVLTRDVFDTGGNTLKICRLQLLKTEYDTLESIRDDPTRRIFAHHIKKTRVATPRRASESFRPITKKATEEAVATYLLHPLDTTKPVSGDNPCIGRMLLEYFQRKATSRFRGHDIETMQLNPLIQMENLAVDGTITDKQHTFLQNLRSDPDTFSNAFVLKDGHGLPPRDINLLSWLDGHPKRQRGGDHERKATTSRIFQEKRRRRTNAQIAADRARAQVMPSTPSPFPVPEPTSTEVPSPSIESEQEEWFNGFEDDTPFPFDFGSSVN